MDVEMWNTLTNTVVHGHEGTFSFERNFHRKRQKLSILKKRSDQLCRQVGQRFEVFFGNQQTVAGKKRTMIEKSCGDFILKNY